MDSTAEEILVNESETEAAEIPPSTLPDLYSRLITEAPYVCCNSSDLVPLDEIPWLDKDLAWHGISFYRKHFTMSIVANTFALMFGFCVKSNSAVVKQTGKLDDPELSFKRYLSTIQRIAKFFLFPFDPARAHKAFATVRKMHALASKMEARGEGQSSQGEQLKMEESWKKDVAQAMQRDLQHISDDQAPASLLTWHPVVPLSQFDMALTQFGFIGTMWLFPGVFGISNREEELKGMIHTWAVIGRLLGIEDKFNVCIQPDPQLYDKLFYNIIVASLKTMDETVVTIQSAFVEALSRRLPFITYKAMLMYGLQEVEGYKGEHLWGIMSIKDKISFKILQAWFWGMRNIWVYRVFMHVVTGIWLQIQFWLHLETAMWDK